MKPFYATLKDKQHLWHCLLREMCGGKAVSDETRDPFIIELAARNVLLIDAFYSW